MNTWKVVPSPQETMLTALFFHIRVTIFPNPRIFAYYLASYLHISREDKSRNLKHVLAKMTILRLMLSIGPGL